MTELWNEQNGPFPKSSHQCPGQQWAHVHSMKLQVMFSGSDLVFGAGAVGEERLKKPLSCVCSLQYLTRTSLGDFESASGQRRTTPSSAPSLTSLTCITLWCLSLQVSKDALYMSSYRLVLLTWGRVTREQQVEPKTKIDPSLCYLTT